MKKLISIVTPCYNESENLNWYYEQVSKAIKLLEEKYDFEIIITDNASTDNSFEIIAELAKEDHRIRGFRLSRNFGYQKSILTGYGKSRGDAVIEYDCDLQDPLEMLPDMLQKWEDGNKIVYGIRSKRAEGKFITSLRKVFYCILAKIGEHPIPQNAGDFMLLDRIIVQKLCKTKNQNPYLRGIIFGLGFKKIGIEYTRNARLHGSSKFPFLKMLHLALDGIVSQSTFPLRITSIFGFIIAAITAICGFYFILSKLFFNTSLPQGFTITILVILFGISINAIFLGIIGEYIARIYSQVTSSGELTMVEESVGE